MIGEPAEAARAAHRGHTIVHVGLLKVFLHPGKPHRNTLGSSENLRVLSFTPISRSCFLGLVAEAAEEAKKPGGIFKLTPVLHISG